MVYPQAQSELAPVSPIVLSDSGGQKLPENWGCGGIGVGVRAGTETRQGSLLKIGKEGPGVSY